MELNQTQVQCKNCEQIVFITPKLWSEGCLNCGERSFQHISSKNTSTVVEKGTDISEDTSSKRESMEKSEQEKNIEGDWKSTITEVSKGSFDIDVNELFKAIENNEPITLKDTEGRFRLAFNQPNQNRKDKKK